MCEKKKQLKKVQVNHRGQLGLRYEQCACQYCDLPQASGYLSPIFNFLLFHILYALLTDHFEHIFFVNEKNYSNNNNNNKTTDMIQQWLRLFRSSPLVNIYKLS